MYHCHIQFYLVGERPEIFAALREMSPLEGFTHEFASSGRPDQKPASTADVILADLCGTDGVETTKALISLKRPETELILLADKEQLACLTDSLPEIHDIWTTPLSREELCFRFLRWQQACKQRKDFWQTIQYLETTINSVPNLVWYKTKDGVHEKVNDSFCRTVNKTKEQVQGRRHAYIWDVEQDDPVCIESERIVMEEGHTCVSEEMVQSGEGLRLLTTYKSPLYNVDGSVMGTVGVAIDVTQERAYEQEILQKNNMLESILTAMDCGVICHTLDGSRIISINAAALAILGYESQEELTRDGFLWVAPTVMEEDKPLLQEQIASLKKSGDSVSLEYRVQHADGKIIHVLGSFKLVEEDGELFCQRLLLDCTAQKLREQQERMEAERWQTELVQALSIDFSLVCVFDLNTGSGCTLRRGVCGEGVLERIFNGSLRLDECMEQYINTCVYAEDRDMVRQGCSAESLKQALESSGQFYINYRVMCESEMRYFQLKAVRTGDWRNSRSVVLGFRNVDDEMRKEMEKKTQLEDALFQANRANKAKSMFLSNMSHDIRTPMNAIVGFTTLAITNIDQRERVEEYLKKILTSGNHLVSLINDVLDMSRIESGKMRLDETLCSLPDILHGLRSIIQADVRAKQMDLYIDAVDVINEDIYCDKLRLNQVLLNLLSNAIKYTGAGGVVSLRIAEKPGTLAGSALYEFSVKDTGIGMSEEFIAHIFEPFERERNSTTSGIQGTGLGMAITKNIVDMMNGTIDVHSKQGAGSEFIVRLPFRLASRPKESLIIPGLKNCRALVVDDDFNTCDSVSYMLQQMGLRAEWTLSGREAVLRTRQAIAREDTYGVYVIDWLIPDMNGVEVSRRIRKEMGEDVPIIILSAYDWSDIEQEAREAGVTAFCSKPLFLSELRRCLNSIATTEEAVETTAKRETLKHSSGRILLAEDNELNQEIAVTILEGEGFTVEVAGNGQIAVEMLERSEPGYYNLILMDVQMPVMDGYEATKKIRSLENRALASIPILAMTANAFEEDKREALRCGMNGHIVKPINVTKLFETLDNILG